MAKEPMVINGKYYSDDGWTHDTYGEALAANIRLQENQERYRPAKRWDGSGVLDGSELSPVTLVLTLVWLAALCLLGYYSRWWYFAGVAVFIVPILLLEAFIQSLSKRIRVTCFCISLFLMFGGLCYLLLG